MVFYSVLMCTVERWALLPVKQTKTIKYCSGDLITGHSLNRTNWLPDFDLSVIQAMTWIPNKKSLIPVFLSGVQVMAWMTDHSMIGKLWPFEYQTSPLFRSPLYVVIPRGFQLKYTPLCPKEPNRAPVWRLKTINDCFFLPIAQQLGTGPCGIAWQHNGRSCGAGTWRTSPCKQCNPEKKVKVGIWIPNSRIIWMPKADLFIIHEFYSLLVMSLMSS